MNKKSLKKQSHISMDKFLRNYCYISNEYLIDKLSSLPHKELKRVCREVYNLRLTTLPFELVSSEEVKCGDVVFVEDAFNNYAPYQNPSKIDAYEIMSENPKPKPISYEMNFDEMIDSVENSLVRTKVKRIGSFSGKESNY